ncbi:hypothetical protein OG21DRAFT_1486512 [Imleria badia]|nr:hypothetical protein OG21DRAFT_1486512 [Imleria badia]
MAAWAAYALNPPPKPIIPQPKRRPIIAARTSHLRPKPTPLKSILKLPSVAAAPSPGSSHPASPPPITSVSSSTTSSSLDGPESLPASGPSVSGTDPSSTTMIPWRPPPIHVLDKPISVCMRFATWLESQNYVDGDALLRAIERDGSHFLSLAKATVTFDNALRGHVPPSVNGIANPLGEHARTLHVFAELLKSKISEGSLSKDLETAVLRDGEALLRLALCCLEFDQAMRGSGGTVGS